MFLLLDTSLTGVFLAAYESLEEGSRVSLIWKGVSVANARSSIALSSLIQSCFTCTGKNWGEVEGLYLAAGPGSFTGIKIGLAFVQGALSLHKENSIFFPFCSPIEALKDLSHKRNVDAILVPATKTNGFLFLKESNKYLLSEVSIIENEWTILPKDLTDISSYYNVEQVPMDIDYSDLNFAVLGHWSYAVQFLSSKNIEMITLTTNQYLESSAESVASQIHSDQFEKAEVISIKPFYLKKSAPEERAQNSRGRDLNEKGS